ncbi:MAG TPA: lysylphosphatidylglycerol synthase transmembrane domain-containing protein [Ktedonobacteraceae bacterium]|nr:lysylphosphatidylglycerol synthase transmembrane domain-containing protein [Ktedonobacteraceae bacterium]
MKNIHSNNFGRAGTLVKPTRLRDFGAFRTTGSVHQRDGSGPTVSVMDGERRAASPSDPITPAPAPEVFARLPMLRRSVALALTASARPDGSTVPVVIPPASSYNRAQDKQEDWPFDQNVQKRAFFLSVRMLCTIVLCMLVLKLVSWPVLLRGLTQLSFVYLLPGLGVGVIALLVGAYQWRDLLQAEHIRLGVWRLVSLSLVGVAFDYIMPFGMSGQRVKAFHLGRSVGNRYGVASSMRAGEFSSLLGLCLLVVPVLLAWSYFSGGVLWNLIGEGLIIACLLAGLLGIIALLLALKSRLARLRPVIALRRIVLALRQTRYRWTFTRAILLGMLSWLLICVNCYFYANALHLAIPLPFYCIALPLVACVSLLPISINGFGLREITFVSLFMLINVPVSLSLLLVLLLDIQQLLFGVLGCGIYFSRRIRWAA